MVKQPKLPFKSLQTQIIKIEKKINKLITQTYRLKQNERAARTRTLIQLGGLVVKSGITEKLGIEIGADLQKEEEQKQKAYTLLGMLLSQLSIPENQQDMYELGKKSLKEETI